MGGETIRMHRRSPRARCALGIGLLVVALASPAGARGEWYDLYEDALQALEEGRPGNAIELLEKALTERKRSGYFRTYGNNYVRYVPHYQLGVAHHDAGECEQALRSFDRSEQVHETKKVPAFAAQLRSLRAACEARLAPPPVVPEPTELISDRDDERAVALCGAAASRRASAAAFTRRRGRPASPRKRTARLPGRRPEQGGSPLRRAGRDGARGGAATPRSGNGAARRVGHGPGTGRTAAGPIAPGAG